jgi:hypothetical protein
MHLFLLFRHHQHGAGPRDCRGQGFHASKTQVSWFNTPPPPFRAGTCLFFHSFGCLLRSICVLVLIYTFLHTIFHPFTSTEVLSRFLRRSLLLLADPRFGQLRDSTGPVLITQGYLCWTRFWSGFKLLINARAPK